MALSFASATGNIFNRLGRIGALAKNLRSYQNTQLTAMTDTATGVVAQFNAESDVQAIMGSAYLGVLGTVGSLGGTAQTLAAAALNRMIFRDNPQLGQTLTSQNTAASLRELIRQMQIAGATVLAPTVAATATAFTGDGNGAVVVSVKRPLDGRTLENAFAETLTLTCIDDSYTGGAAEGAESFAVTGQGSQTDVFAFNWPLGSNCSIGATAIDAGSDNANGNLLTNSDFTAWSGGSPENFTVLAGLPGTAIVEESTIVFGSAAALRLVGDGSTLTQLYQPVNAASSATQYGVCLWMRRDGVAPAAGVLTIDLADANGTVLLDEAGVANSFTVDLTTLTTNYAAQTGVFRTPYILPATVRLRLRLSTALTNGRSVYLDRLSMGAMTQLYVSGPFVSVHSGADPFAIGDRATATVTNSRGAAGTLDTFQTLCSRLFPDVMASEFLLPSAASPSVSDGLI